MFRLHQPYKPAGDQPKAIEQLTRLIERGNKHQTLLGVTGSGKTFTMANIIANLGRPALVISHNKTLAAQLYQEFKTFFPKNAIHYFVSYYDYYQPEAYIPQTDTYIEKDARINDFIDAMRHATTATALTRNDFVIVASVSCIYGIGNPQEYQRAAFEIKTGNRIPQKQFLKKLAELRYERNDIDPRAGTFRVRGDIGEIAAPAGNEIIVVEWEGNAIDCISIKPFGLLRNVSFDGNHHKQSVGHYRIFPAKHFVTPQEKLELALSNIEMELQTRAVELKKHNKLLEARRLLQRTRFDIAMLREMGFIHGIENYSRHLSFRKPGEPPYTLLDYLPSDFVTFIDESHMSIPQIRGMYAGDRARKLTLIEYGFRLPSALDNRPLRFEEFNKKIGQVVYVSATPGEYELEKSATKSLDDIRLRRAQSRPPSGERFSFSACDSACGGDLARKPAKSSLNRMSSSGEKNAVVEQLIRPTGLLDPHVEIRSTDNQMNNIVHEVQKRITKKERVIITTLTKRMAEDLAEYLKEKNIRTEYLHSDIKTIERTKILTELRKGVYDVIVGINLLREGIDLPEVSLVIILDADKEGFLRNAQTLIQTIGRAARHTEGTVLMYADTTTDSMKKAIEETERRRYIQQAYNKKHGIAPKPIKREINENIFGVEAHTQSPHHLAVRPPSSIKDTKMRELLKKEYTAEMLQAATMLDFEKAAELRDLIKKL